jgi:hypothetical protein
MALKDEGGSRGGDGFCMIDPVVLGGVITDLADMETAIITELNGLKAEFEKVGVSTHPITNLLNVSHWLHEQLPMLRRRHSAAVLLESQELQFTPGTHMLSMPEDPAAATQQAANLAIQQVKGALNGKPPGRDGIPTAVRAIAGILRKKGTLSPDDLAFLETFYRGLGKDVYRVPDFLKDDENWIAPTRTTYTPGEIVPTGLDAKTRAGLAESIVGGLLTLSDERRGGGWNRLPAFVREAAADPYEVITLEDGGMSETGGGKARELAGFLAHAGSDDRGGVVFSKRLAITAAESAEQYIKLGQGSNPTFTDDGTARTFLQIAGQNEQAMHDLLTGKGMEPPEGVAGDIYDGYTGPKDFLVPVTTHAWSDDGKAASAVVDWIADAKRSTDPSRQTLGREAMQGLVTTLTDPSVITQEMDIDGGQYLWSPKDSLGQVNPEIARSLARDTAAFLKEFSDPGASLFTTEAKGMRDGEVVAARFFTLVATDQTAAEALAGAIYRHNVDGVQDALAHPDHVIDQSGRAGQLQGLLDSALHNVAIERTDDKEQAKAEADAVRAKALGVVSQFAGQVKWEAPKIPGVDPVDMADEFLGRFNTMNTEPVEPQQIKTFGVDTRASGAARLVVRYDITTALVESGQLKVEDLPQQIRTSDDPPRLKSPAEFRSENYNAVADVYRSATTTIPAADKLENDYLNEYSSRITEARGKYLADDRTELKTKLRIG